MAERDGMMEGPRVQVEVGLACISSPSPQTDTWLSNHLWICLTTVTSVQNEFETLTNNTVTGGLFQVGLLSPRTMLAFSTKPRDL